MEQFNQYFDLWYLIIIVLGGEIITDSRLAIQKPFWLKAFLLALPSAWKIMIFSLVVGVGLYYLDGTIPVKILFATFLFANSFYALVGKFIMAWLRSLFHLGVK